MNRRSFIKRAGLFVPFAPAILHAQIMPSARRAAPRLPDASGDPPPSYLFEENFNGTGYENAGWSADGDGTADPDYTTTILEGSHSLALITDNNTVSVSNTFTGAAEVEAYFMFRPVVAGGGANRRIFEFHAPGPALACYVERRSNNVLRICYVGGASPLLDTVATADVGTTYHVWVYYKNRTSTDPANGIARLAFSTDGTKPTSGDYFAEVTTGGGSELSPNVLTLRISANITWTLLFDKVRIGLPIGSNPA